MSRGARALLLVGLVLALPTRAPAEEQSERLVAIVNAHNALSSIDKANLQNIYLGHQLTWSDGTTIRPFMRPESSAAGHAFFRDVLKMTPARFRHHWQELELSGQATAPKTVATVRDALDKVSATRGGVSYVVESEAKDVSGDVKIVKISE